PAETYLSPGLYPLKIAHAMAYTTRHATGVGQPTLHQQVLPYLVMRGLSSTSTSLAGGLLRLRGRGLPVGQSLQQAPDGPGRAQFDDGGMMVHRTQDAQGGLHVQLATGDGVQKNRVTAKEAQTPGLPVWVAFPQGLLGPRPHDGALAEPPEGNTEGQP